MIGRGVAKLRELAENRQPEKVLTGIGVFDALTGGLIRGGICELSGADGAGKRSLAVSLTAAATGRGGVCAVVDGTGGFDPVSAERSGALLEKILWVRCGGDVTKAILSAEYLIQARLFELIWLDLAGFSEDVLATLPSSYWYRFKTGLQGSPGSLLVTLREPRVRSAAHQTLRVTAESVHWHGRADFNLIGRINARLECLRPVPGRKMLTLGAEGY